MRRSKRIAGLAALFAVASGLGALTQPASAIPIDDYAEAYQINQPGTTLPRDWQVGFSNSSATVQPDEPHDCNGVDYGATLWAEIYPDRPGLLEARASGSGFELALAVMRFNGNLFSGISERECTTSIFGLGEYVYPRTLQEGQGYKLQLGGVGGSGSFNVHLIFHPDSDRDGVLDRDDRCPETGGPDAGKYMGCPDADGDGVPDITDRCKADAGPSAAAHQGCPDHDGDGFPDIDDRCPSDSGIDTAKFTGCPDNDQDGVPEGSPGGSDGCPGLNARNPIPGITRSDQKEPFGCPDTLFLHNLVKTDRTVFQNSNGLLLDSFTVTGVPRGTRVSVSCRLPNRRRCGGVLVRRATRRRITVRRLEGKRLPYGTRITVRATAAFATGKFILIKVVRTRSRVVQVNRCMDSAAPRKLRRDGCT